MKSINFLSLSKIETLNFAGVLAVANKPEIVTKSNALVSAAYRLTVAEQRILLACIAQVNPREPITDEVMYKVTVAHIAQLTGNTSNSLYEELKEATLRLWRREVWIGERPNGAGKYAKVMVTRWVQTVTYNDKLGEIELRFSKDMIPYISDLRKEFTRYALSDVMPFDSAYSIRLYELLCQYVSKGERTITIEELRQMFMLEDQYPVVADLKKRVIDISIADIHAHTAMRVLYEPIKTGRRITAFKFIIRVTKTAATLPPVTIEPPKLPAPEKPKLTRTYIEKHARPGESWEAATERLRGALDAGVN